jgi:hypothetical protein
MGPHRSALTTVGIRGVDRLGDDALKAEFAGVPQDEFAVPCLMAVELKARLAYEQRLENRLALDERKVRDVPAVQMQEIEGEIDEADSALISSRT